MSFSAAVDNRQSGLDISALLDSRPMQPVLLPRLVSHWEVVQKAEQGVAEYFDYLRGFDQRAVFQAMIARPEERGRIFYRRDFKAFNFTRMNGYLTDALEYLASQQNNSKSPTFYLGANSIVDYLPGLEKNCRLSGIPESAVANIWLGNRVVVPTHNDKNDNVACVVSGRRRFTLFAPEQELNLYIAQLPQTPAGRPVSRVDVAQPDLQKYPRYASAQAQAITYTLEPGDALYIPKHWWHNVESLDDVNTLVNFWW